MIYADVLEPHRSDDNYYYCNRYLVSFIIHGGRSGLSVGGRGLGFPPGPETPRKRIERTAKDTRGTSLPPPSPGFSLRGREDKYHKNRMAFSKKNRGSYFFFTDDRIRLFVWVFWFFSICDVFCSSGRPIYIHDVTVHWWKSAENGKAALSANV